VLVCSPRTDQVRALADLVHQQTSRSGLAIAVLGDAEHGDTVVELTVTDGSASHASAST
jgi:hypothetical protein